MPLNADEEDEESIQNMVSNLPLLFANGYPSTLDKITEKQLEKFIPFMVQCSLGNLQYQTCFEHNEPEWWPEDLEFVHPFAKPKGFAGDWYAKMKELVIICYMFHKSVYLLRFCNELSSYEPECLRFINNYNSTTSLYDRVHNKILVTFRNENMLYDQQNSCGRKTLLTKSQMQGNTQMVETEPFDIYLCDNCDAELYSLEAYKEHEKTCMLEDDVIICDDDEDDEVEFVGTHIDQRPMADFLLNFNLQSTSAPHTSKSRTTYTSESIAGSPEKLKRLPRKSRGTIALTRCNSIPLSSPCGVLLMKRAKTIMTEDYQMERLDRLERFCFAPALKAGSNRPKWFGKNKNVTNCTVTYKKPQDHIKQPYHTFKFPRRQFWNTSQMRNLAFIKTLQLAQCKPLSVNLQRLTKQDIEVHMAKLNHYKNKLNTFKKKVDSRTHVVEFIDLCSSGSENEQEGEDEAPETTEHISLCSDDEENSETKNVATEMKEIAESSMQSQLQLQPLRTSYLFSNNIDSTTPTSPTPNPPANESIDNFSAINEWLNNNANNRRSTAIDKALGNTLCRNLAHEMANFTT